MIKKEKIKNTIGKIKRIYDKEILKLDSINKKKEFIFNKTEELLNDILYIEPDIYDNRCAPSKEYKDESCFTIEQLKKICDAYNNNSGDNINYKDLTKKQIVDILKEKLKDKCNDQIC